MKEPAEESMLILAAAVVLGIAFFAACGAMVAYFG